MASLNRGIIFDNPNTERNVLKDKVTEVFKEVEGIDDVLFFTDAEVVNMATSLADRVTKAMKNYQEGKIEENPDDIYSDPEFIKKFNNTLVINTNEDTNRNAKFIFIDRKNAKNIDDAELLHRFALLSKIVDSNMTLHIPSNAEKLSQIECFYDAKDNTIRVEKIGAGAPSIIMHICRNLTPEEIALKADGSDKAITTIPFPYGSVAEIYDEMLAFILDVDKYDTIFLGISNNKDDKPVLVEVSDLEELYSQVALMQAQIKPYGVIESNVITMK